MLKAHQAHLRASATVWAPDRVYAQLPQIAARVIFRIVPPGSIIAHLVNCPCRGRNQLADYCPFHGKAARRLAHG